MCKAQEVYFSLTNVQSSDYEGVKAVILHPYELVPEAYRQHFISCHKGEKQMPQGKGTALVCVRPWPVFNS